MARYMCNMNIVSRSRRFINRYPSDAYINAAVRVRIESCQKIKQLNTHHLHHRLQGVYTDKNTRADLAKIVETELHSNILVYIYILHEDKQISRNLLLTPHPGHRAYPYYTGYP